jgi:sigma-54 dependent transcriptional regulator, flagellar regulatory protein
MRQREFLPSMSMGMRSALDLNADHLQNCIESDSVHALFDSFHDGIIIYDPNGTLKLMNLAAEQINRLKRQDLMGLHYAELLQRSALNYSQLEFAIAQGLNKANTPNQNGKMFSTHIQYVPTTAYQKPYIVLLQYDSEQRDPRRKIHPIASTTTGLTDPQERVLHLSPLMSNIADMGVRAFRRNARLLLLGEPGVGKTAIAQHIHRAAGWSDRPFIHVNCGSIPDSLFESEMFGYERGAFTGALQNGKKGYIESAAGGTLFLDEIGEIPLHVQAKLLKFLEDSTIHPVGSPLARTVQVQVITATNKDLRALVARGEFRADLYYRLSVLPIEIPPLRAHLEDLPVLMDNLLDKINQDREPPLALSPACRDKLMRYAYPGNIRELVNIFERLAVLADDLAQDQHLPPELLGQVFHAEVLEHQENRQQLAAPLLMDANLKTHVQHFERDLILKTITQQGSKIKAAQHLGIDVATLTRKLQRAEN